MVKLSKAIATVFALKVTNIMSEADDPKVFKHPKQYNKITTQLVQLQSRQGLPALKLSFFDRMSNPIVRYTAYVRKLFKAYPFIKKYTNIEAEVGIQLAILTMDTKYGQDNINRPYRDSVYRTWQLVIRHLS